MAGTELNLDPIPEVPCWEALVRPGFQVPSSLSMFLVFQGIARTQSPTNKNYAPELLTFGVIARVNPG